MRNDAAATVFATTQGVNNHIFAENTKFKLFLCHSLGIFPNLGGTRIIATHDNAALGSSLFHLRDSTCAFVRIRNARPRAAHPQQLSSTLFIKGTNKNGVAVGHVFHATLPNAVARKLERVALIKRERGQGNEAHAGQVSGEAMSHRVEKATAPTRGPKKGRAARSRPTKKARRQRGEDWKSERRRACTRCGRGPARVNLKRRGGNHRVMAFALSQPAPFVELASWALDRRANRRPGAFVLNQQGAALSEAVHAWPAAPGTQERWAAHCVLRLLVRAGLTDWARHMAERLGFTEEEHRWIQQEAAKDAILARRMQLAAEEAALVAAFGLVLDDAEEGAPGAPSGAEQLTERKRRGDAESEEGMAGGPTKRHACAVASDGIAEE